MSAHEARTSRLAGHLHRRWSLSVRKVEFAGAQPDTQAKDKEDPALESEAEQPPPVKEQFRPFRRFSAHINFRNRSSSYVQMRHPETAKLTRRNTFINRSRRDVNSNLLLYSALSEIPFHTNRAADGATDGATDPPTSTSADLDADISPLRGDRKPSGARASAKGVSRSFMHSYDSFATDISHFSRNSSRLSKRTVVFEDEVENTLDEDGPSATLAAFKDSFDRRASVESSDEERTPNAFALFYCSQDSCEEDKRGFAKVSRKITAAKSGPRWSSDREAHL